MKPILRLFMTANSALRCFLDMNVYNINKNSTIYFFDLSKEGEMKIFFL